MNQAVTEPCSIALIDHAHETLLVYLEGLTEAVGAGESSKQVLEIVEDLIRLAEGHFDEEEQLMRIHEYPLLDLHLREHEFLLHQVSTLRDELKSKKTRPNAFDHGLFARLAVRTYCGN